MVAAERHSMSLLPPLLLYRRPHFRHRGCTIISFMVHSLFLLASPSPSLMRLILEYANLKSLGIKKDFHTQNAAVSVSKNIFMHKRPPFRYQKIFSCTKGRRFGTKKDFHAQKAAVSVSKKIFIHKRPPFQYQKTFSCTKGRRFGTKKDFHAQKAAVCGRN